MPKMTQCVLNGKTTSIEDALVLRATAEDRKDAPPVFRCNECGQQVRAHNASEYAQAHFEHLVANEECPNFR